MPAKAVRAARACFELLKVCHKLLRKLLQNFSIALTSHSNNCQAQIKGVAYVGLQVFATFSWECSHIRELCLRCSKTKHVSFWHQTPSQISGRVTDKLETRCILSTILFCAMISITASRIGVCRYNVWFAGRSCWCSRSTNARFPSSIVISIVAGDRHMGRVSLPVDDARVQNTFGSLPLLL